MGPKHPHAKQELAEPVSSVHWRCGSPIATSSSLTDSALLPWVSQEPLLPVVIAWALPSSRLPPQVQVACPRQSSRDDSLEPFHTGPVLWLSTSSTHPVPPGRSLGLGERSSSPPPHCPPAGRCRAQPGDAVGGGWGGGLDTGPFVPSPTWLPGMSLSCSQILPRGKRRISRGARSSRFSLPGHVPPLGD